MGNSIFNSFKQLPGDIIKKKTFLRIFTLILITSYVILTMTTLILYSTFEKFSIDEIHLKSVNKLKQTSSVFTSLHFSLIPSFIELSEETVISKLIYSFDPDFKLISKANERLDGIIVTNPVIHSIFAYNYLQGIFYSTLTGPEKIYECSDSDLLYMVNNIKEFGVNRYNPRLLSLKDDNNKSQNVLTLFIGNMPKTENTLLGGLIINISETKMREMFSANDSENELIIIDKSGLVLTHPSSDYFGENISGIDYIRAILSSDEIDGSFISQINGVKTLITFVTDKVMGWRFITLSPYNRIVGKITLFRNTTLILFFILAVFAGIIVFITSKRIYLPIGNLFQYAIKARKKEMKEGFLLEQNSSTNELQYLDDFLKKLLLRADRMDNYIKSHKQLHRQEVLKNLLEGSLDPLTLSEEKNLGLNPKEENYIIAVMKLDHLLQLYELNTPESFHKLKKSIEDIAIAEIKYQSISVDMDKDRIVLLIMLKKADKGEQSDIDLILKNLQTVQKNIRFNLDVTVTIGISKPISMFRDIVEAYNKALTATKYRFCKGYNTIIHYSEIEKSHLSTYQIPDTMIRELLKELKIGHLETVENLLDIILKNTCTSTYEDFLLTVQVLIYKTNAVFHDIARFNIPHLSDFDKLCSNTNWAETTDEIHRILMDTYRQFSERMTERQNRKYQDIISTVVQFIDENLADQGLCPDLLADHVNLSTNYLRKLFKKLTDISISEYINSKRIEECKQTLINTEIPVKEFYRKIGFINYNYFFTAFKKYTGLTPQRYRLEYKQHKNNTMSK